MFPTLFRLASQATEAAESSLPASDRPFQLKKVWPPDFTKLSPQAQLRFEKKYKRRVALKYARPRWNKAVKLVQLVTVTGVVAALFFSETTFFGQTYRPSEKALNHIKGLFGAVDADKRYERRVDAPPAVSPRDGTN
ncbi:hypothetical protein ACRALDRAFT_1071295 [Sodiomyces alcalophilus JCM 7366]|uniref:uncharacterized protein n=1 Tax=Sodiomyces alcalophilus JCM 7366 TaxID=591952 RepID=UPI0039B6E336